MRFYPEKLVFVYSLPFGEPNDAITKIIKETIMGKEALLEKTVF